MKHCRGMRMGYAPLLALLENARHLGYRRLAVIGIPCQVYALRALEQELGFDRILVIGTPCSDNTSTENFHSFLARLSDQPDEELRRELQQMRAWKEAARYETLVLHRCGLSEHSSSRWMSSQGIGQSTGGCGAAVRSRDRLTGE